MPDQQPIFPSGPNYVITLEVIGKIDQVEVAAVSFLNGVPNNWSQSTKTQVANYMNQITALINQLNSQGVTGIRNKDSQSQVAQTISNIVSLVNLTLQL